MKVLTCKTPKLSDFNIICLIKPGLQIKKTAFVPRLVVKILESLGQDWKQSSFSVSGGEAALHGPHAHL